MINKASFITTVFIVSAFLSTNAFAIGGSVIAGVDRVLVSDPDRFGGCMIELTEDLPENLNCAPRWVTFSCDGTFSDKATAYQKLDAAKMAKATNVSVEAFVDDTKTIDNYCYVWRFDLR